MKRKVAIVMILLAACLVFCGCQSEAAKAVDERISALSDKTVNLELGQEIHEIDELDKALSEKEHSSLKNYDKFASILNEYMALEDAAVQKVESMIDAIPAPDAIRLSSESKIEDAVNAFDAATEEVKSRISNKDVLDAAVKRMEQVKKECWVPCSVCGGDGIVTCSLCGGKGSRKVNYTTPNGLTWQVSQECYKTQTCNACGGEGGRYVEKP